MMSKQKNEVSSRKVKSALELLKGNVQAKRLNKEIANLKGFDFVMYAIEVEKLKAITGS